MEVAERGRRQQVRVVVIDNIGKRSRGNCNATCRLFYASSMALCTESLSIGQQLSTIKLLRFIAGQNISSGPVVQYTEPAASHKANHAESISQKLNLNDTRMTRDG